MQRSRFLILTVLLLVIGTINYLCRKELTGGYADFLSYNQLYFTKDQLHISRLQRLGKDSFQIVFEGKGIVQENHFEVYTGGLKVMDRRSAYLTIRASPESTIYGIKINDTDSIALRVEFPEFSTASLPVIPPAFHAVQDWCADGPLSPGDSNAEEIAGYLRDSMGIKNEDSAVGKVLKIGKYILFATAGKYGQPTDSMRQLPPMEALNCVRAGRSKLQCGNFGSIFSFFANKAGVPARYIASGVTADGMTEGTHVVNEVWLADHNCWAYIDLTDGILFVKRGDRYLNTLDIFRLLRYDSDDPGLQALHCAGDSLTSRPYGSLSFFGKNAFNYNNRLTFYYGNYFRLTRPSNLFQKLKGLLYPAAYYAIYSENGSPAGWPLYLRLCSGYLFSLIFLFWICMLLFMFIRRGGPKGISNRG